MKRPIVLLDCDGPMANFTEAYLLAFMAETQRIGRIGEQPGRVVRVEDVTQWSIHACDFFIEAAARMGIEPEKLRQRVDKHVVGEGFCKNIPVQSGALKAVERLKEIADVYIVTSPWHSSRTWMYERTAWLWQHFGIPAKRVIHTSSKHLVMGDVFVDDKAEHVREWSAGWVKGEGVLFDMHHNRGDGGLQRGTWADVDLIVRRYAGA